MEKMDNIINDMLLIQIELRELDVTSIQNIFMVQALAGISSTVEQLERIKVSQTKNAKRSLGELTTGE